MAGGVVVTGMGCVCAAGTEPAAVLHGLAQRRNLRPGTDLDPRALPNPFFAVEPLCFGPAGRRHSAKDTLSLAQLAVAQALAQAAPPLGLLRTAGVALGTTAGSALHFLEAYAASRAGADAALAPFPHDRDDYFAANLALELDIPAQGPRLTITDACTSGADAVGLGLDLIRTGQCPCVVCGGADALSLVPHTGFARLMIYAPDPCRPFDRNRKGLNLGEGAAALILEDEAAARSRGASILGWAAGFGNAADAHHFTAPHPQGRGLAAAINAALDQAGITAADLAFVNVHGTATKENDKVEGGVLRRLLPHVPVWASKGGTGHTLGAAGALEAVLTLAALRAGIVPASPGFAVPDPEIGLVPTTWPQTVNSPWALSTSLGFGGGNAALILRKGDA